MKLLMPTALLTIASAVSSALLAAPVGPANSNNQAFAAGDLLIENVTVISPERDGPLARQWVHVQRGRVVGIASQPIQVPAGTARLDGAGKFLTPGLMDSHVHISSPPGLPTPARNAEQQALVDAFVRQQPRSYLYHGVTQLLDPANAPEAVAAFNAQPAKPDLFRCGAAPVLNGYPTVFADPAHRHEMIPDFIYEPANQDKLPAGINPAEHTPEAIVAKIKASGAPCIKVFIENGFGDQTGWPIASLKTLQRVRDEAHKQGLLVIGHANAIDMQQIAVAADVDVIAHGLWNWTGIDGTSGIPEVVATLMQAVHDQHIGYQPTLRVLPGLAALLQPETLRDPAFQKVVPASLLAWYKTPVGNWFADEIRSDVGGNEARALRRMREGTQQAQRALRYLHALGHPVLLASDTPSAPTYGNQPGYNSYQEMQLLAEAGIPLDEILRAGTLNNAKQFRLEKDYGTVEVGKRANLLLLTANPLASVDAWNQIDTVILHGNAIGRASLAATHRTE